MSAVVAVPPVQPGEQSTMSALPAAPAAVEFRYTQSDAPRLAGRLVTGDAFWNEWLMPCEQVNSPGFRDWSRATGPVRMLSKKRDQDLDCGLRLCFTTRSSSSALDLVDGQGHGALCATRRGLDFSCLHIGRKQPVTIGLRHRLTR